ncbi:hypothetical protein Ancab_005444 [Ancistrocladus abbreviatus]
MTVAPPNFTDLKIDLKAVPGVPGESYINVQSSCDGVILFSASSSYDDCTRYAGQQLFLCNPITRASYRLPSLPVSKKAKFWDASEWLLSYDKQANSFKVTGSINMFVPANPNLTHHQFLVLHVGHPKWQAPAAISKGRGYRFCIQSGKMEVWTAKNWDRNCWAKDVFQLDPLLLSKIAQFDQTTVQPIDSMGDKIFVLIGCGNNMHPQLALLDLCSRKVKLVCFAGDGHEFDAKGRISCFTYFDVLCHVGGLLQLP